MNLEQLLFQLGLNITSNAIYDLIKLFPTTNGFTKGLESQLNINNANIQAQTILEFLAQKGDIVISGTSIFAQNSIIMQSAKDTKVIFGEGSASSTKNTKIEAGYGAKIVMQGGAQVRQSSDGSISFYT
jgi:hypothetical protein